MTAIYFVCFCRNHKNYGWDNELKLHYLSILKLNLLSSVVVEAVVIAVE